MEKISSVSFGMKMPTRQVIELGFVNNADTRVLNGKNLWTRKVEAINQLTRNKVDVMNSGSIGGSYTFENVAAAIKEQFPQLNSFWTKIAKLTNIGTEQYYKKLDKIYQDAEKQLGPELDVNEELIELAVI